MGKKLPPFEKGAYLDNGMYSKLPGAKKFLCNKCAMKCCNDKTFLMTGF